MSARGMYKFEGHGQGSKYVRHHPFLALVNAPGIANLLLRKHRAVPGAREDTLPNQEKEVQRHPKTHNNASKASMVSQVGPIEAAMTLFSYSSVLVLLSRSPRHVLGRG